MSRLMSTELADFYYKMTSKAWSMKNSIGCRKGEKQIMTTHERLVFMGFDLSRMHRFGNQSWTVECGKW